MDNLFLIFLVWVVGFGSFAVFSRKPVADFFVRKIKLPRIINFLIIAAPIVIIEEAVTCSAFPSCLKITFPALILHLVIFFLLMKWIPLNEISSVVVYGIWGSVGEFWINDKLNEALGLGVVTGSILIILNTLIYMVIIVAPNYYRIKSTVT